MYYYIKNHRYRFMLYKCMLMADLILDIGKSEDDAFTPIDPWVVFLVWWMN